MTVCPAGSCLYVEFAVCIVETCLTTTVCPAGSCLYVEFAVCIVETFDDDGLPSWFVSVC